MNTISAIKNRTYTVLLSLLLMLPALRAYSQQSASANILSAEIYSESVGVPGTAEIILPIKVRHFTGSNLAGFSLKWDPSVVTFLEVERLGAKGMAIDHFNIAQAGRGLLVFSPKEKYQALADGSVLFALNFMAIGNARKNTQIFLEGQSSPIGSISVGKDQAETAGIQKLEASLNTIGAYPNPFTGETRIAYIQSQDGKVSISITDLYGRLVKGWTENKTRGNQELVWDGTGSAGNLLPPGLYLCTLRYEGKAKTIKLIKTE